MTEENMQMIQYQCLQKVKDAIERALENEPADYGENNPKYDLECDIWKTLNELQENIGELLKDEQKENRKFEVGKSYLRSDNRIVTCTKRTDVSVWFGGARFVIAHSKRGEYVKAIYKIEA